MDWTHLLILAESAEDAQVVTVWDYISPILFVTNTIICLIMIPIVVQRRRPGSAMAWLLVIFFLPIPGFVLYMLIGEERLAHRRMNRHARLMAKFQSLWERFRKHPNMVRPEVSPAAEPTVVVAENLGHMPILGGNSMDVISQTDDFIDRLVADIDAAEDHVHLLFYIYVYDETGQRVAAAMGRAAKRGVVCRLLVDAVGSSRFVKRDAQKVSDLGVDVRPMLPVGIIRRRMSRIDMRNHRKLAVIDGRIGYTGSQNIVNANYGKGKLIWHDMMVRLTGPVTLEFQAVFLSDWYHETEEILEGDGLFPDPVITGDIPAQTLPSGPSYPMENYQRMALAAIHGAREQVTITTPYFVPDEPLIQAIQVAVLRGVRVRVIAPRKLDQILVGAAARAYYDDLLQSGAELHLFSDGLLHAKTLTVDDDIALVGTANFDIRSFALNFELNVCLYQQDATLRICRLQDSYAERSRQVTAAQWRARSRGKRLFEDIVRMMSPLL